MSTYRRFPAAPLTLILFASVAFLLAQGGPALAQATETGARADSAPVQNSAAEPQGQPDPVALCWNTFEAGEWGRMTDCLQEALKRQETLLEEALRQASAQAAQSLDSKSAARTLKQSSARWVSYRESECERQQAFVAGRNHPDIGELTCRIRQTAQRIADLKFDE